jgi:hypothetical protein
LPPNTPGWGDAQAETGGLGGSTAERVTAVARDQRIGAPAICGWRRTWAGEAAKKREAD